MPTRLVLRPGQGEDLSGTHMAALLKLIGCDPQECDYFEALVRYEQSGSVEEKNLHYRKLLGLKGVKPELVGKDRFEFYSEWYHAVVRELLFFYEFRGDYAALGREFRSLPDRLDGGDILIGRTRDTAFTDSTLLEALLFGGPVGSLPRLEYRVRVRNTSEEIGLPFRSAIIAIVPPDLVATSFRFAVAGRAEPISRINEEIRIVATWSNPGRDLDSVFWRLGDGDERLRATAVRGREGSDTLTWRAPSGEGGVRFSVTARDRAGDLSGAAFHVSVNRAAPTVAAGSDVTVSVGDTVLLRGGGRDPLGSVVKWEWNVGPGGGFATVTDLDTAILAPDRPGSLIYVLRATDDDGNTSADSLTVTVVQDAPRADAGKDTLLTINDTLRLAGRATDLYGRIVMWEWDVGRTGTFVEAAGGRFPSGWTGARGPPSTSCGSPTTTATPPPT